MAIMNILNGKNTVLDFFKDAINKKEYARAYYILTLILKAKEKGFNVLGPFPADGFFASGNYKEYDGILGMYHDQGLIPFKILSKNQGVNFTAGLPIIRTSPDHGTAYDIAGKNKASFISFKNHVSLIFIKTVLISL